MNRSLGGPAPPLALRSESRWPVTLTILALIAVQVVLSRDLSIEPVWLLPSLEAAILAAVLVANPSQEIHRAPKLPGLQLALLGALSLATLVALWELVDALIQGSTLTPARLLADALVLWLANAVVFSLWYWELDAGGPAARAAGANRTPPAFLFPQHAAQGASSPWRPVYGDYLYLSFTNQTAFSPTDTMPLTLWAKGLMAVQSIVSIVIAALVISRAVNVMAS